MEMRSWSVLGLPALVLSLCGCGGATSATREDATKPASVRAPSRLQSELERELVEVEDELATSETEALLDRRLVLVAALAALDRAEPGEPPHTWSKDELLAAMRVQLEQVGRDRFEADLVQGRKLKSSDRGGGGDGLSAEGTKGDAVREDDAELSQEELPGASLDAPQPSAQPAARLPAEGRDADRQAAIVQTGHGRLSPEAQAVIRRHVARLRQCVPPRGVRTQVRVRAQLHQGRLRAPAVSADPPVAAVVSGCIIEALSTIEVPVEPDAPSRVVTFPFVVEAG